MTEPTTPPTPAISHPSATIYLGDCLDVLAALPADSVDAIVTDPPYGLGFMGKAWDDLPPGLPWARECLRVLKPGGHLLSFGGTRTWHRLAVAVEDAGFEMRDSIAWLYGSGFPKSLDVSKAIDKVRSEDLEPAATVARFLVAAMAEKGVTRADVNRHLGHSTAGSGAAQQWTTTRTDRAIKPRVPTWEQWETLREWLGFGDDVDAEVWRLNGRKGKPGDNFEAREVLSERVTVVEGGNGGWSDLVASGRFKPGEKVIQETAPATPLAQQWAGWGTALKPAFEPIVVARKPLTGTVAANVLEWGTGALNVDGCRVHADDVRPASPAGRWPTNVLLDGDAADALDEQSGTLKAHGPNTGAVTRKRSAGFVGINGQTNEGASSAPDTYGDSGGASRYFPTFRYQAKAPTRERPTVVAEDGTKTAHPTVKPLALMRWLVRLVTPPGGTVLDTFAGSGATIEAAVEEGFHALGIERESDYLPLIQIRLDRATVPDTGEEPTE